MQFAMIHGDPQRGIVPAPARHWLIAAAALIVAQWVLAVASQTIWVTSSLRRASRNPFGDYGDDVGFVWALAGGFASVVLAFAVVVLSRRAEGRNLAALGLTPAAIPGSLQWLFVGLFACIPAAQMWLNLPDNWQDQALRVLPVHLPLVLIQSGAEEVLFRSVLLAWLAARYGAARGLIISALLFGAWHVGFDAYSITNALSTIVFGIMAGVLVLHQGHLGGAIALHFVWNVRTLSLEGLGGGDFWMTAYATPAFALDDFISGTLAPLAIETILIYAATQRTFWMIFGARNATASRSAPEAAP